MPYASDRLGPARADAGITRKELAARIRRSEKHLGNVERGEKPMKYEVLAQIAKMIGVPVADLLANPPDRPRSAVERSAA